MTKPTIRLIGIPMDLGQSLRDLDTFGVPRATVTATRAVVEAMNGTVEVHSSPGVGSRFTVSLPIARDAS